MENKQNIKDLIQKFYPYAKETLGFEHPVRVIMRQDAENAQNSLGKTAYYDPAEKLIVLYITDRHPKDVLRSFSHELVHHAQNCRGELDDLITGGHYAENGIGREIESEAYLQGNLNVRDWENSPQGIELKGVNEMKMTKSQLKGIIESVIRQISEGKMPMKPEPEGKDLNKDGKKGHGKVPAFLDEQEMVIQADIELPPEAQGVMDALDDFLSTTKAEDAETQALVKAVIQKLRDKELATVPGTGIEEQEAPTKGSKENPIKLDGMEVTAEEQPFAKLDPNDIPNMSVPKVKTDEKEEREITLDLGPGIKESNDTWYQGTLYERLVTKWTK